MYECFDMCFLLIKIFEKKKSVTRDAEGMLHVVLCLCGAIVNDFSDQSFFYLIYNIGPGLL